MSDVTTEWMGQAIALGALGEGSASPNPRVGCVVVKDGKVVGQGFHRAPGEPHAEAVALEQAGDQARGATAYVSLEPCAHHGRTPPCTDRLIESGVRVVVAAIQDPNPLVDGRGFESLRRAGIEVEVGCLSREAELLNEAFFFHHRVGRPLVTLKAALSLDGMMAAEGGRSKWITGEPARRFAHRLRLRHDVILVGGGTFRADRPRLDVRLGGIDAPRQRAVVSASLDLDPEAPLFDGASAGPLPRVYTATDTAESKVAALEGRATVVRIPGVAASASPGTSGATLDLRHVLVDLERLGAHAVLVEGGAGTHAAFLDQGLADRAALFYANKLLGAQGATPLLDRAVVADPRFSVNLVDRQHVPLGEDTLIMGRLQSPASSISRGS